MAEEETIEKEKSVLTEGPAWTGPEALLIDNRAGNTLEKALRLGFDRVGRASELLWQVNVATSFFKIDGYRLIADELDRAPHVRLLLGAEPRPEAERTARLPGDPPEPVAREKELAGALGGLDEGLRRERDLLPFDGDVDRTVRRLLDLLDSERIEVRRYTTQYLHAKAFELRTREGLLMVGSSNLTRAGLEKNVELNLGIADPPLVARVGRWFDELWETAEEYDLAAVFRPLLAEFPPYLIYLRVLMALYGKELQEEADSGGLIPLTTFQKHGVHRALRILERYGGVLVADGVGLGKTFTAGEIMRRYIERKQRVLLVCPAALRDTTWEKFASDFQLFVERVSYEQLAADPRLGGSGKPLDRPIEEYALVVVDESQAYRNPSAPKRAGVLRRLLQERPDLVLLSATPVNNSLLDLQTLLTYFLRQDSALADRGVLSVRERFRQAEREEPATLSPDLLYPVIDATTVKRTRQFVLKHYANDTIELPDGSRRPIRFPKPIPRSIHYDLEAVLPGFFPELEAALQPATGRPRLILARYKPENYELGKKIDPEDTALVGLVRSGLLKRFESSGEALRRSLGRMIDQHERFLNLLDRGLVVRTELLRDLAASDEDDWEDLIAEGDATPASRYDVPALRRDARSDLKVLSELRKRLDPLDRHKDPKLEALVRELERIASAAGEQGLDEEDRRNRRKVLVFSYYDDTVDWILEHLEELTTSRRGLAVYEGRIAGAAGTESWNGVSRMDAIYGFAPVSTGSKQLRDRFDLLVATDVLAEGLNLQQCGNIINFDLPWNPMRLVQRHGRIDRINSSHDQVYLRTFFPDRQLDGLLRLEQRVRWKLAQAAASVGLESAPIPFAPESDRSFAETKEEIEKLLAENASLFETGGTKSAAQTGEEYRQELRQALQNRELRSQLESLPWKAGSGLGKGDRRGHVFCAGIGDRVYLRFVPVDPTEPVVEELGTCLRIIECSKESARVMPRDLHDGAYDSWQQARKSIHLAWMYETDPKNLQPRIGKINRDVAAWLRTYPSPGIAHERLQRAIEAVEAPASGREANMLREVFGGEYANEREKSKALVMTIEELGLRPFVPPQPLPPIEADDVHLICWMAVEQEGSDQLSKSA
jgi:hypothetical protein